MRLVMQPQILIFNAAGELVAIARSIRSAAELTKVDETEIKLCCENRLSISGQYCFRYNVDPSIADDDAFGKLTIAEYNKLCDYKKREASGEGVKFNTPIPS